MDLQKYVCLHTYICVYTRSYLLTYVFQLLKICVSVRIVEKYTCIDT